MGVEEEDCSGERAAWSKLEVHFGFTRYLPHLLNVPLWLITTG